MTKDRRERKEKFPELREVLDCMEAPRLLIEESEPELDVLLPGLLRELRQKEEEWQREQKLNEQRGDQDQQYKIHSIDGTIIIQDPQHNFYIAELKPLPGKGMLLQKRMEQKMSLGDLAAELKLTSAALNFYLKDFIDYW